MDTLSRMKGSLPRDRFIPTHWLEHLESRGMAKNLTEASA